MTSQPTSRLSQAETWLAEHGGALLAYAVRRLPDVGAAEDAVQETLVAALGAADSFQGQSTVLTWLTGILRRKIADFYRKRSREVPAAGEAEISEYFKADGHWAAPPADWGGNPATVAESAEFQAALAGCLEKLGPTLRGAFQMRVLDELKTEEVCSMLDISPTNLSVRLTRARLALRDCLEKTWV